MILWCKVRRTIRHGVLPCLLLAGCQWLLPLDSPPGGADGARAGDGATFDAGGEGLAGDGQIAHDGPRVDGSRPPRPPIYDVTADGWGVRLPLFRGPGDSHLDVNAIWGSAINDVWVVGAQGRVIHNFGQGWRPVRSGTTQDLHGVWGGSGNVWIVGAGGTVLRFDGKAITPLSLTPKDVFSVHGNTTGELWLGGPKGLTVHRSAGVAWKEELSGAYLDVDDIHVGPTGEVWVPDVDRLRHYQGGQWSDEPVGTIGSSVSCMASTGTRPTFLGTSQGNVLVLDNTGTWKVRPYGLPGPIKGLYLDPGGVLWGAGQGGVHRFDASSMTNVVSSPSIHYLDIWGAGAEIFSVGYGARMAYFDGQTWLTGSMASEYYATDVAGRAGETWVVGDDGALRDTGRGLVQVPWQAPPAKPLRGVWVGGPGEVFAVGENGVIARLDAATGKLVEETAPSLGKLRRVTGVPGGPVWAAGENGIIERTAAGTWKTVSAFDATDIWARAATDVWAVSWAGGVLHQSGSGSWTKVQTSLTEDLYGVHGSSASDIWVVGDNALVAHFDGASWTKIPAPAASGALKSVWVGPKAVWVAGDDGVLVLRNNSWKKQDIGTAEAMISIWGRSDADVWACGDNGYVVHFDDRY